MSFRLMPQVFEDEPSDCRRASSSGFSTVKFDLERSIHEIQQRMPQQIISWKFRR